MSKWWSAAACALLLALARLLLHVCALDRARSILRLVARALCVRTELPSSEHAVRRVAKRLPWRATCLHEALAADALLANAGVACDLVIGARRAGGAHHFHAWLEHDGRVLIGASELNHTVLQ